MRLHKAHTLAAQTLALVSEEIDVSDGPTLQRTERLLRLAIKALEQEIAERADGGNGESECA